MNGVIIVNKEQDFTSFDVVACMRGILHEKKIGHGGTLDPKAEGVLPVFVGSATKLCDFLPDEDKCYEAEMTLGIETDTEDIWGEIIRTGSAEVGEDVLKACIMSFIGEYDQIPPMYSAKKVNGRKLYDMARNGEVIERKPERVRIEEIVILSVEMPRVRFRVSCSKGTYIRTLCADIGRKLGTSACMSALKRIRHGRFMLENAHTLSEIEETVKAGKVSELLIPVEKLFPENSRLIMNEAGDKALMNGNKLNDSHIGRMEGDPQSGYYSVCTSDGVFRAIYQKNEAEGIYVPLKMFLRQ